jgi:myosin-crossreactive antigen
MAASLSALLSRRQSERRRCASGSNLARSVYDETVAFNAKNPSHSQVRLVDRNRFRVDVKSMGFSLGDRLELLKLTEISEERLGTSAITDWLSPGFFETRFWFMWATTFAFQPWHSAVEFKRYLHRFMMEFSRIETLAGVRRTVYNQYDSLVRPLARHPAACRGRAQSATVLNRIQKPLLLRSRPIQRTSNSRHQPQFAGQPEGVQVFWGYALHPDRIGDFVAGPMADCSGEEILRELCGHLNFDYGETFANANCIPCRMPYITSMFMPRARSDRPLPVPPSSTNLASVSQFCELADDVVFTVEYSVRAAQTAVYQLLQVDRQVPPVTPHDQSLKVKFDALIKAFE